MSSTLRLGSCVRLAMCAALACAAPTPPKVTPAPVRLRTDRGELGRVAVVEAASPGPFVAAQIYSPGMEVLKSTGTGALVGVYYCSFGGEVGQEPELALVMLFFCVPVAVPVGALVGTLVSEPNARQEEFELAARKAVSLAQEEPHLVNAATRYAEHSGWLFVDASTADSVVELRIARMAFLSERRKTAYLRVDYDARLIRTADGSTLGEYASSATSLVHPIDDWMQGEAQLLRMSLVELLGEIAEDAMDELVLVYAGERELVAPTAPRLLEPASPSITEPYLALRWEAWPWGPGATRESTDSVVYDLRVRELGGRHRGRLEDPSNTVPIYERFGLKVPEHVLTKLLPPCGYFAVQLRARFPHGGVLKATEWISVETPLETVEAFDYCALPWYYVR